MHVSELVLHGATFDKQMRPPGRSGDARVPVETKRRQAAGMQQRAPRKFSFLVAVHSSILSSSTPRELAL